MQDIWRDDQQTARFFYFTDVVIINSSNDRSLGTNSLGEIRGAVARCQGLRNTMIMFYVRRLKRNLIGNARTMITVVRTALRYR